MYQASAGQMLSPLLTNRATSDDTDVQSPSPQAMSRSLGVMRRSV
jgi:hypothetical protein